MNIIIAKFTAWTYEDYKNSKHPEYAAIRKIVSQHPQHKFILIGEGPKAGHFERDGIQFFNINSKTEFHYLYSLLLKLELGILLRPSAIVVMGTINVIPFGWSTIITRSRLIPAVTGEIAYGLQDIPNPFQTILSVLLRATLHRSDTILCLSKGIREELVNKFEIDPQKIMLYNYRISETFNPNVPKILKPILNPNGPVVLTLCRVSREKGLEYLIEASERIIKEVPNVRILIKGSSRDERYKEKLTRLMHKYNLDNNVSFLEFSPNSEVPKFLSASDVFVLPSLSEGLPLAMLEAMATGVPVVASKVGGIPDILTDGYNGLMVEPRNPGALAEAILRLLRDDALRKRLVERGLETVRGLRENEFEKLLNQVLFQGS
jgi:glycosyltransferase involved in cell wall biosynthesis